MVDAPLAYSEVIDDEPVAQPWLVVWRRAAAVIAGCVLAAAVVLWWQPRSSSNPPPSAPPVPATTPAAAPSTVEPAPTLAVVGEAQKLNPPSPDTVFLAALDRADVHMVTRDAAINQGHVICRALQAGHSPAEITAKITDLSPGVSQQQVSQVVDAAIDVYCPQYQR